MPPETYFRGASSGIVKIADHFFVKEFDFHQVPHISGLVPNLTEFNDHLKTTTRDQTKSPVIFPHCNKYNRNGHSTHIEKC